jgi:hypothetical protein
MIFTAFTAAGIHAVVVFTMFLLVPSIVPHSFFEPVDPLVSFHDHPVAILDLVSEALQHLMHVPRVSLALFMHCPLEHLAHLLHAVIGFLVHPLHAVSDVVTHHLESIVSLVSQVFDGPAELLIHLLDDVPDDLHHLVTFVAFLGLVFLPVDAPFQLNQFFLAFVEMMFAFVEMSFAFIELALPILLFVIVSPNSGRTGIPGIRKRSGAGVSRGIATGEAERNE